MIKIKAYGICVYRKTNKSYEILLCKSVKSKNKWGFLKGVQDAFETNKQTALREFLEESSINIDKKYLENDFTQINEQKDITIYLVNIKNIKNIDIYFNNKILKEKFLSNENTNVEFFDINSNINIKKKQIYILNDIINFLNNK